MGDKKQAAGAEKRRQMFKPLLSNPYMPRQAWHRLEPSDQQLILDWITREALRPLAQRNSVAKGEQQTAHLDDGIVVGFNAIMETLERYVQVNTGPASQNKSSSNGEDKDQAGDNGVLFVCRADMATPLLYAHLPLLCALARVRLVQLDRKASHSLTEASGSSKKLTMVLLSTQLAQSNAVVWPVIAKVPVEACGLLGDLQRRHKLEMDVKFVLTDAPIKKREK